MLIKIIGDNHCARATRHLLRMAGFAISEFLPSEAITEAPHFGYAITIECSSQAQDQLRIHLAPAPHTPAARVPETETLAGLPSFAPNRPTHAPPASTEEEASAIAKAAAGVSSPAFVPETRTSAGEPAFPGAGSLTSEGKPQAVTLQSVSIHFDSVDSPLEAAVLRHVTQLAKAPVIVDRPGGVVHSERELRIVLPHSGDVKTDEAAAVAVEFGVLRGLLDLISPPSSAILTDPSGVAPAGSRSREKKKWWMLGMTLLLGALLEFTGSVHASPRHVVETRGVDGAYLHLEAALAAPAQGQFADGQLNIALIGGTAVSGSLYDSGNTALKVNCVVGCGASGFSDNAAFSAGSTTVNNISAVFNDSITALTSGNAGALRSTTDRMLYVNVGKLGGTALSGANVVDSGNTAFRVNCVVGCSASAGFTDNSTFTAGTATESNIGGVFNDGLSTLSSGNGAAARITSSRALHINLRNASGTEIGTASNPVRMDPVGTTTQPVSWSGQSVSLTGSWPYSGALGTVSLTGTLPAFGSTPAVSGSGVFEVGPTTSANSVSNTFYTQVGDGANAMGTMTNFGSSPSTAKALNANVSLFIGTTAATTCGVNGCQSVGGNVADGSALSSNNDPVVIAGKGSGNARVPIVCDNWTVINQASSSTATIISGVSSKNTYFCSINLVVASAQNINIVEGTGTNCGTTVRNSVFGGGTTAASGWNLAANGGVAYGTGIGAVAAATGATADNICLMSSGTAQISGTVSWTQF